MAKKSIESKYQKLTDTEHVLLRPSMYIGSVAIHTGDQYLYDGEKVTIDDCARASRALEAHLEANALVAEQYVLEVSSPGADRPLRHAADWRRFLGRHATVTSGLLAGGKQEVEILALDGEAGAEVALVRDSKGREVQVPLRDVTQARLAFHWKR